MAFLINLAIIISDQMMLFMINILVARHSGEELFGDYTVATNGLLMIATFTTLGVDLIIAYYVPKLYDHKKYEKILDLLAEIRAFLKPKYLIVVIGGVLITISCMVLSKVLPNLKLFEVSHPLFLFLWGTISISLYNIYLQFLRGIGHMRTAVVFSLLQRVSYFVFSMFIAFCLYPWFFSSEPHYFPHVMLIGFISSYIIMVLICVWYRKYRVTTFRELTPHEMPRVWRKKIYGYTIQNINGYIYSVIPLLIMELMSHDEVSVGLFSAVISIIALAEIAIAPLGILMGPEISAALAQNQGAIKKVMKKYLSLSGMMGLMVMLIIGIFARQILIIYQSGFISALPYVYACLVAILIYALVTPISIMVQASRFGNIDGAEITIALLVIQLIFSLFLIPWLGMLGGILCFLALNLINLGVMIGFALRVYHTEFLPGTAESADSEFLNG